MVLVIVEDADPAPAQSTSCEAINSVGFAAPAKPAPKKKSSGVVQTAPAITSKPGRKSPVTAEQRLHYVEVAAYYLAERRGPDGSDPAVDWAAAEAEIDRLLADGSDVSD